jgi:hypothetical protein
MGTLWFASLPSKLQCISRGKTNVGPTQQRDAAARSRQHASLPRGIQLHLLYNVTLLYEVE